jgi:hypothetical protein
MFRKEMNKKAQEGMTLTTLLAIILGVVVLVILILGFTQGFDYIFGFFNQLPKIEAVVQVCGISAQSNLVADYCREFKSVDIDGVESYVTCPYLESNGYLTEDQKLNSDCTQNTDDISRDFCYANTLVKVKDWKDIEVNGKTCFEWFASSLKESCEIDRNIQQYKVEEIPKDDLCNGIDVSLVFPVKDSVNQISSTDKCCLKSP